MASTGPLTLGSLGSKSLGFSYTPNLTTKEFYAWEKIGFDFIGGVPAGWRAKLEASVETVSLDELYAKAPPNTTPCQGEK